MCSVQIFSLCALFAVASAIPVVYTGQACSFIIKDTCTIVSPFSLCHPVTFGKCIRAFSFYGLGYDITYYNPETNVITFRRFTDSECKVKAVSWSHPAPSGKSGDCIGPIAHFFGVKTFTKFFIYAVPVVHTTTTTKAPVVHTTTTTKAPVLHTTTTTKVVKPTTTMKVEKTAKFYTHSF